MTGETSGRGAAAPPTAVLADGDLPPRDEVQDQVTIHMPAEGAYLSVLRTATAGLAARLDFTLDEIEDLRIAVDEACGMLLGQAAPGANLECDFTLGPDRISIAVSALSLQPRPPSRDTFAWTVLSALAGSADAWVGPGNKVTVLLRKVRESIGVRVTGETETRLTGGRRRAGGRGDRYGVPDDFDAPGRRRRAPRRGSSTPCRTVAGPGTCSSSCAPCPTDDVERLRIRAELVELHLPLVEYLARRFRNRGEWLDDLTQVATIGLIKSIDRFDLGRGVEFSTYATPTIVGEIKRHFRDKGWAVRVPRRLQELKLALTKAISDLAQREGRAPTVAEIAAHLQMTEEEVLEGLESANAYSTVSLDAPDSGDDDAPAVAESLGMLDEALEGVEYRESLKPLLEQLPSREKRILLLRFFGNMTQSQIASELGISQMHVSRLLARTLAQLREGLTADE